MGQDLASLQWGGRGPFNRGIRHGQMAPVTARLMQRLGLVVLRHVGLRPVVWGTALQPRGAEERGAQGSCGGAKENECVPCGAAVSSLLNVASGREQAEPGC